MATEITGGELVVRMLAGLGVRYVFGVPGGQTLAINDAIIDHPDIDFVAVRHEGAAAVMADAWGRMTGTPGVCLATTGPGATNLITGVGGALRDSSPVLVLTCNNNGVNVDKDDAQNADHIGIFRPLVKWSRFLGYPNSLKQGIEEAYINAVTGNPGPVHLDFARDAIEGSMPDVDVDAAVTAVTRWTAQRPVPATATIEAAADLIRKAERPVLWLGNGVNHSVDAGAQALDLARQLRVPVLTTFNGIGCVPTTDPLVFGAHSRMGTSLSHAVLADADLILAIGNSLNAVSTSRWSLPLPQIIQVDVDASAVGRYYADRTFGVIGDAGATLGALAQAVDGEDLGRTRGDWLAKLGQLRQSWWSSADLTARSPFDPAELVRIVRAATPDDTLLIPDAGNAGVWSYVWDIRQIGTYMKPVGFGNMGFALPAAVAAALNDPERPVVALVGDGSLGMTLAELETLQRCGGRVVVVVIDDSGYGNIRQEQVVKYGDRIDGVDFGFGDYAMIARAFGMRSSTPTTGEELHRQVTEALEAGTPTLIHAVIDASVSAWTYPAFVAG